MQVAAGHRAGSGRVTLAPASLAASDGLEPSAARLARWAAGCRATRWSRPCVAAALIAAGARARARRRRLARARRAKRAVARAAAGGAVAQTARGRLGGRTSVTRGAVLRRQRRAPTAASARTSPRSPTREEANSFPAPASVHHKAAATPAKASEEIVAAGAPSDAEVKHELAQMQAVERTAKQAQQQQLTPVAGGNSIGGNGTIPIPTNVPEAVQQVIAGANAIADFPYVFGGGHASFVDNAYDCSGSVSYALAAGGLLGAPETSGELESWGAPGPGRYITVFANAGTPTCTSTASCTTRPGAAACTPRAGRSARPTTPASSRATGRGSDDARPAPIGACSASGDDRRAGALGGELACARRRIGTRAATARRSRSSRPSRSSPATCCCSRCGATCSARRPKPSAANRPTEPPRASLSARG